MMECLRDFKYNLETLKPINGGSPFTTDVLAEVLATEAKLPHLKSYDGSTYQEDHIYDFFNTMQLHN